MTLEQLILDAILTLPQAKAELMSFVETLQASENPPPVKVDTDS